MACHTNRKYRSTLYFMNQNHTVSLVFRLITVIILLCSANNLPAKGKEEKKIWAFAYGTCLNDSVVYVSAISAIPEASIDKKNNFLNNLHRILRHKKEQTGKEIRQTAAKSPKGQGPKMDGAERRRFQLESAH